jgi:CheY-like chemotaxis protein
MIRRLLDDDIVLDIRLARHVPHVLMDGAQLEQVLMNLIINASDAMRGGGTLKIRTRRRDASDPRAGGPGAPAVEHVEVTVSDTGVGMPSEVRERIFEPFFTTKPDEGTGMGLATVYGIVEQAGGWIEVESEPGVGTTFSVVLPVAPSPEPESPPTETTLLVVEDEPALRQLVATMLAEDGYQVLEARNGLDALAVAERHDGSIDLLITDVVMPHLTGPELARTLQGLRPGLEVLFMSGYNDSRLVGRGLAEGAARLLVKPFTPEQLLGTVRGLTGAEGQASLEPGHV